MLFRLDDIFSSRKDYPTRKPTLDFKAIKGDDKKVPHS